MASIMATATGRPRARARVYGVEVIMAKLCAKIGLQRWAEATTHERALALPGRCPCALWRAMTGRGASGRAGFWPMPSLGELEPCKVMIITARGRYEEETSIARGEEQLDVKMDVKLDMELDMKISHGRAREEREACARGEEEVRAGQSPVGPAATPAARSTADRPAANRPPTGESPSYRTETGNLADFRLPTVDRPQTGPPVHGQSAGFEPDSPSLSTQIYWENKDSADIINWREFEALCNEMRREFRAQDDELKDMLIAIENLTAQQQQQEDDEDPELEDDAHNARGAPRGHRPRGWVPLGRNGRGQDEEDGLGKPKFSIPKFEGGADVEEYLTWELKIEKLWSLHPNYSEDKKIKLASSEFDGYALRWWDSLVRNRDEDGAQPIRTWRAMKEVMTSRFVPTNYMRNIFDKLTLLRQGVKTVDEYYMEMEMLMQRGRVLLFLIPFALAFKKPSSTTMSSSSSSSPSSDPSYVSSPIRESTPEWGTLAAYDILAPTAWDQEDHDFSVWSEDDKSLTDGESDPLLLADGDPEEESDDDRLSWADFTTTEEEEEEENSSSGEPPASDFPLAGEP
ncbi:hypothetical protein QYE76_013830 [Lolium multiflorum]|uniref:Retrotransposon gag domain-containing protein n=1 Tax=Lolium multiflorum TaxID=4521 RepID=A0AAD8U3E7_LOLMU|nr:hypothetical protein QYE76_013830 [Lolium multiflorum]